MSSSAYQLPVEAEAANEPGINLNKMIQGTQAITCSTLTSILETELLNKRLQTEQEVTGTTIDKELGVDDGEFKEEAQKEKGNASITSGGLSIGKAGAEGLGVGVGTYMSGAQKVAGGKTVNQAENEQTEIIKTAKDNRAELELKQTHPVLGSSTAASAASNKLPNSSPGSAKDSDSHLNDTAKPKTIADYDKEIEKAESKNKQFSKMRSTRTQVWNQISNTTGTVFTGADSIQRGGHEIQEGKDNKAETVIAQAGSTAKSYLKQKEDQKSTSSSAINQVFTTQQSLAHAGEHARG
jgi:hypothetical protein